MRDVPCTKINNGCSIGTVTVFGHQAYIVYSRTHAIIPACAGNARELSIKQPSYRSSICTGAAQIDNCIDRHH